MRKRIAQEKQQYREPQRNKYPDPKNDSPRFLSHGSPLPLAIGVADLG
ncbi:MAG: hypothetical protein ACJ8C4_01800 [Gemmataceae bacterium]